MSEIQGAKIRMGSLSAWAWNPDIECDVFRAARKLTVEAANEDAAIFLACLQSCFHRGLLMPDRLLNLAHQIQPARREHE